MMISVKLRYNNLCIRIGTGKVRRLNQSRSKCRSEGEIPEREGEKND